jgi:acetyl esterase/lipase
LSPLVNMVHDLKQIKEMCDVDPVLPWKLFQIANKWYVANDNIKDLVYTSINKYDNPIYTPALGDSKDIGKITIFIGTHEALYHQVHLYHQSLLKQGIDHNYFVGKRMFHVYAIFRMPEGKIALRRIVKIINAK